MKRNEKGLLCADNGGDIVKYGSIAESETSRTLSYSSSDDEEYQHHDHLPDAVTVETLHNITSLPMADEHGHLEHYPGEEKDQMNRDRYLHGDAKKQQFWLTCIEFAKCFYSGCLLSFSILIVMGAIFTKQTVATRSGVPIPIAFCVFWFLIVWLAQMEGGQSCLVGLQPIDKSLYADSHPLTHVSTAVSHKGGNMERFIVGRQFLVLLVVFTTNLMASSVPMASVFGLSPALMESFLGSGVAVTLIAIMIGQSAQINAANCMLDFINNYFWIFTTYASLLLDMSGLLHSVYLFQMLFAKLSDTPEESEEPPRTRTQEYFFWARVAFSCAALVYSFAVTLTALMNDQTTMYPGVPGIVSIVLLFFLLCFVGLMEGMQIALFAVVNLPAEDLKDHPLAKKSCELTFQGSNLQAFLIGRQMCVTFCHFFIARITSCRVLPGEANIFGVSDDTQAFFDTGLLGAIITTIIGSLAWRLIASVFPVAFLSNPFSYANIRMCLFVESTGACSVTWLLAVIQKQWIFHYQLDEVYIGTAEERAKVAAAQSGDVEQQSLL